LLSGTILLRRSRRKQIKTRTSHLSPPKLIQFRFVPDDATTLVECQGDSKYWHDSVARARRMNHLAIWRKSKKQVRTYDRVNQRESFITRRARAKGSKSNYSCGIGDAWPTPVKKQMTVRSLHVSRSVQVIRHTFLEPPKNALQNLSYYLLLFRVVSETEFSLQSTPRRRHYAVRDGKRNALRWQDVLCCDRVFFACRKTELVVQLIHARANYRDKNLLVEENTKSSFWLPKPCARSSPRWFTKRNGGCRWAFIQDHHWGGAQWVEQSTFFEHDEALQLQTGVDVKKTPTHCVEEAASQDRVCGRRRCHHASGDARCSRHAVRTSVTCLRLNKNAAAIDRQNAGASWRGPTKFRRKRAI